MIVTKLSRRLSKVLRQGLRLYRTYSARCTRYDEYVFGVWQPPDVNIVYCYRGDWPAHHGNKLCELPDNTNYNKRLLISEWPSTVWGSVTDCHSRINIHPLDHWMRSGCRNSV